MHPDYYQNEINAYEDQLNNNDLPISDTYRKECEYMLWRSKELLNDIIFVSYLLKTII